MDERETKIDTGIRQVSGKSMVGRFFKGFEVLPDEEFKARDKEIRDCEERKLRLARENVYRNCGVPARLQDARLDDLLGAGIPEMRAKNGAAITSLDIFRSFIADVAAGKQRTMLFFGNNGTGKSVLAACIAREICLAGVDCGYYKSYEIMQRLDDVKWHTSKETRKSVMHDVCGPQFRVIDELGRYPDSKQEQFMIFDVTNRCYESYKSSIYISNRSRQDVGEFLGEAVVDRIRSAGVTVEFTGGSLRGSEKELYVI